MKYSHWDEDRWCKKNQPSNMQRPRIHFFGNLPVASVVHLEMAGARRQGAQNRFGRWMEECRKPW